MLDQASVEALQKNILNRMLKDSNYEWRKIATLARQVLDTEENTEKLLIDIGARRSEGEANVWRLG